MEQMWIYGLIAVTLVIPVKILVPKMMDSSEAKVCFGIGVILFLIYTVILLMVCSWLTGIAPLNGGRDVFVRFATGVIVTNLMVLFTAFQYYMIRDKRKMTESEKMKLRDL